MSRKNLSRTVIEGGRYYANSYFRRSSHGLARARTRDWLDEVALDLDEAEASDPRPPPRISKMFRDKLGPARRWLDAQVGRPWNKVYSELRSKFDSRTIAGAHVVNDHMLGWVRRWHEADPHHSVYRSLVIDRHGILRQPMHYGRSFSRLRREAIEWAAKRLCALTHRGWRWVRRVTHGPPCGHSYSKCPRPQHHLIDGYYYHRFFFHDAGAMTKSEIRRLHRFPAEIRRTYVIADPWARG